MLRSFFHKSSTVAKAIEEAWLSVGCPESFTIKVVEREVTGFLWFNKKPAIISFTYTFDQKSPSKDRTEGQAQPVQKVAATPRPHTNSRVVEKPSNNAAQGEPEKIKRRELKPKAPAQEASYKPSQEQPSVSRPSSFNNRNSTSVPYVAPAPRHANPPVKNNTEVSDANAAEAQEENNFKSFDFNVIKDFIKGLFIIASPDSSVQAECCVNDKNLEVRILGLDSFARESFINSQTNKALCLLIAAVLKKDCGRRFQKYRIVILFE